MYFVAPGSISETKWVPQGYPGASFWSYVGLVFAAQGPAGAPDTEKSDFGPNLVVFWGALGVLSESFSEQI